MLKAISTITNALGALNYKGTWNASSNTPTLADGTGAKGDYYVVSTAGTQTFGGVQLFFGTGDWIAYNGAVWQRVEGGSDGNFANVTLTSTDAGATASPLLELYRDSATPAASDTLGEIRFNGEDSAGNKQAYGLIHGSILSPTSTAEQGQLHFETATAGTLTEKMIIGTTNLVINEIGAVFNVRIEGDADTNLFTTDATNDRIGVGTASPATKLDVSGTITSTGITTTGNTVLGDAGTDTILMTAAPSIGGAGYGMGMAYRNRFINGSFAVDQRNAGASQTITAAAALAYTVDRWYAYSTGANVTGQQIAGAYTSSKYQYQFTGAASVTAIGFGQRIESANCFDLANNTATLSCFISNSLLTTVTWTASYANTTDAFGTLASPTVTSIATGTFTVTSSRVRYLANITIPSAATTGIQIVFTVGAQTSGTWIIDSVQLEKGATAIAYDDRPYGTELVLSQRYYQQIGKSNNVSYQPYGVGLCTSTTTTAIIINLPVMMRVTPTLTFNGATDTFTGTAGTAVTAVVSDVMSPTTIMYQASVASGLTTGNGARHYQNAASASSLELSSEL